MYFLVSFWRVNFRSAYIFFIDNQEPIQISDSHENIFLENELVH